MWQDFSHRKTTYVLHFSPKHISGEKCIWHQVPFFSRFLSCAPLICLKHASKGILHDQEFLPSVVLNRRMFWQFVLWLIHSFADAFWDNFSILWKWADTHSTIARSVHELKFVTEAALSAFFASRRHHFALSFHTCDSPLFPFDDRAWYAILDILDWKLKCVHNFYSSHWNPLKCAIPGRPACISVEVLHR